MRNSGDDSSIWRKTCSLTPASNPRNCSRSSRSEIARASRTQKPARIAASAGVGAPGASAGAPGLDEKSRENMRALAPASA